MDTHLNVAFGPQIAAAATRHHLDPRLLAAVAAQETGGPGADSGRNVVGDGGHGHGVFQIDDRWHAFARSPAAMDPARNADYAAGLLESNLGRYGGDVRAALSAYNAGSPSATGTRTDWGDGRPVGYADSVLRHYARLGGDPGSTAGFVLPPAGLSGADTGDDAASVDALRGAAADLGYCPAAAMPLNLPAYRPLPQADGRDRDLAPAIGGADDDSTTD
ncbi:MAG TPA: transglycosylase SLT domain-containing protein [Candidatus Elarobacter sp.]|nr:transglycosylase SLT domain-containing protein [Candidatus Elarobacter sp.]